jgi:hypothetical protein
MSAFFGSISLEIHQRKSSSRFFTSEHRGMPALRAPEFVANIKPPEPAYVRPAASSHGMTLDRIKNTVPKAGVRFSGRRVLSIVMT